MLRGWFVFAVTTVLTLIEEPKNCKRVRTGRDFCAAPAPASGMIFIPRTNPRDLTHDPTNPRAARRRLRRLRLREHGTRPARPRHRRLRLAEPDLDRSAHRLGARRPPRLARSEEHTSE